MAIAVSPKVRVVTVGDNVSVFDTSIEWTMGEKSEQILNFKDTDGDIDIDLSNIQDMELILIYSEDAFKVKMTVNANTIETIVSNGVYMLNTTQAFIDTITTFAINTVSTTDIQVIVNIYGNEV